MCGYLQNGDAKIALVLFIKMGRTGVRLNEFTLSTSLKAYEVLGIPENGMQIHGVCAKSCFDWVPVVGNSMIDINSKCGMVVEAAKVFNTLPVRNVISWNAMITGYTHKGNGEMTLNLFRKLQQNRAVPDGYTYSSSLMACSCTGAIGEGMQIHVALIRDGFPYLAQPVVAGALVDLYVKCRRIDEARRVFNRIEKKSVMSWNTLILGYAHKNDLVEAMHLFRELRETRKQMHGYTIKVSYGLLEIYVANSVLDMHMKCGLTDEADALFREMLARDVVSWTAMITGYRKHGLGNKAVELFNEMQVSGIEPDSVTYLVVLLACSHSGLFKEGKKYFSSLCCNRKMKPQVEHYACMVDLLGRSGHLKEANDLIEKMPIKPNVGIWRALLSVCRTHGDLELGKQVGEILLRLDGSNPTNYVFMSNIYANAGYWKESEKIRETLKRKGLNKEAGRSWVEIDMEIHIFYNGDDMHLIIGKIHQVLKEMENRVKEETCYVHSVNFALHDVEEESKVERLRVHSEKLAIGLVLVRRGLKRERPIKIFKNLRVCGDCHTFIKSLSKVLKIVFVVRDANSPGSYLSNETVFIPKGGLELQICLF
ncbi:hypothetical protein Fmac_000882 [Flemingia macrophylla]|uniref:DYW domain-containing protein n=1 Tax=Flemingia macrophylla TaxID=520843 RepID=A0ABD1NFH8_9FABA